MSARDREFAKYNAAVLSLGRDAPGSIRALHHSEMICSAVSRLSSRIRVSGSSVLSPAAVGEVAGMNEFGEGVCAGFGAAFVSILEYSCVIRA